MCLIYSISQQIHLLTSEYSLYVYLQASNYSFHLILISRFDYDIIHLLSIHLHISFLNLQFKSRITLFHSINHQTLR